MTSYDLKLIFDQIYRVLKSSGELVYLCTHPFRQYLERKNKQANYFEQEKVR